ncbi:PfkB family carbohydrate kinase [Neorhizobium alkalisoli]|uniref:Sugar/nucleoside kinase (Ribokinase family) n=1 Tax=Neorhizobium alkalisoli TaxID=528178 RepID=A0A561R9F0_9HYPH|nr:PfkB family carbohydrate kinase [Neorhizobium alkalisoli]TWF59227.1 sugar/nucleoside kinase (ribokinase family) [Neorhizobium alkalisoli]
MPRVIVIGGVNHDRIWRLSDPLVRGGRLHVASQEIQLGGGGFFTGSQLLDLGAEVSMVTWLRSDAQGYAALDTLKQMGFETREVAMEAGETSLLEILLEPNGERTIMGLPSHARPPFTIAAPLTGNAAYINALSLDAGLVHALDDIPIVVTQLPLRPATPRPADYVISSRDDVDGDLDTAWQRAGAIAGSRLKMLVLTDGPEPITLFDGKDTVKVVPQQRIEVKSAIGAGDRFSGAMLFALLEGKSVTAAAAFASTLTADWLRRRDGL